MAETVAQHSVATFTTPVNGTSPIDATTVRGNDNTLRVGYNDHDADPGVHLQSSLLASRPAAGDSGRKWLTTDVAALKVYFDTGSAWSEISYLPLSGGTVAGNVSITGTLGVTGVLTATGGVVGNVTGNASTATALQTARAINGVNFDGTAAITVTAAAGTLTGATLASNVLASSLTSVGTLAALTVTAPITGSVTGSSGSTTGNAATATALQTARTINGTSFDGTANITVTAAAGTLTGATLASNVLASSLTSIGTLATLAVTGTATLNTVPYTFPASQGSASTILTNDGSGTLTWSAPASGPAAAGTLTGATLASNVLASSLTSVGTLSSLAVSGTTALRGVTYTWPAADGTNTYVLSTNGSGTLSWAAGGGGTTTNSLTAGTYLTGSPFNGSAAITFAVDATDANTASKVVARDASGNFSAGTVTAALTGNVTGNVTGSSGSTTGNAATATALATARAINGVNFDGTAAITVADATKLPLAGGTLTGQLTGATNVGNIIPFYYADQTAFPSATTYHGAIAHSHADGKMFQAHSGAWVALANESGNVATATALQTARAINGTNFDGTAAITVTAAAGTLTGASLASGVTASSLTSVGTLTGLTTSGTTSLATTAGALSVYGVAYGFPAAQGAASTVLTNNGSGTLTWAAPAAGAAAAGTLTGATLASNVLASSLTSVGTLAGVTIGGNALFSPDATYDIGAVAATRPRNVYTSGDVTIAGIRVGRGNAAIAGNTVVGTDTALGAITTGTGNIAVGPSTLMGTTSGNANIAVGRYGLYLNTTGGSNVGVGFGTLAYNSTQGSNTAIGTSALNIATAADNTSVGSQSLASNTTGNSNTALGFSAGHASPSNTTGSNNTFIGYNASGSSATASNVITLGNSSIGDLRCQVTSISGLSDARDKTDIAPIPAGLAFVNALNPVSFVWNMRDGGKVGIPEFGFIAQDLQQVQADHGTVPNLVRDENPDKLEASAGTLIPVLVKAIQELTTQNTLLAARVAALETI